MRVHKSRYFMYFSIVVFCAVGMFLIITAEEGDIKYIKLLNRTTADNKPVFPVLVLSCNRILIRRCLTLLLKYRPSEEQFPIIVSQGCSNYYTKKIILDFRGQVHFMRYYASEPYIAKLSQFKFRGYYRIASHYKWALNVVFENLGFKNVIIVEDDLEVSPDFFEYFLGTHWLLKKDPSILCISAWNDVGQESLIDLSQPDLLHRTDFFPGLGWMLTASRWNELKNKWPSAFWDDWLRKPQQMKGRSCIRPEISRTKTFGNVGVSNGQNFVKYLQYIHLNEDFVNFTKLNLSYLLKENYDKAFFKQVDSSPIVSFYNVVSGTVPTDEYAKSIRILYKSLEDFKNISNALGFMDDMRSGIPRAAYNGVVSLFINKKRTYVAPKTPWKGYNLSWE